MPGLNNMCLYPQLIKNRKYTKTKKNKGNIPMITDERTRYVPIGCGKCIECTKKKARDWQVRLSEEIRNDSSATFVTLTFSDESYTKLNNNKIHKELQDNEIATKAIRLFLERWRKSYKKSPKHWLITELGHNNTERIHIHGLIFGNQNAIEKHWQYGYVYLGQYVNEKTINYIVKYITKIDLDHKWFSGKIHCSPGIGKNYLNRYDSLKNHYKSENTNELYSTRTALKLPLPIYYRNKIYSENEREQLWINKLNKEERYILGKKIDVSTPEGEKQYEITLKSARKLNKELGYGSISWDAERYKKNLKKIKEITTITKKIRKIESNSKRIINEKTSNELETNHSSNRDLNPNYDFTN